MHGSNLAERLQGGDEYMNLVLDEAEEVSVKRKSRKPLGEHFAQGCSPQLHCGMAAAAQFFIKSS